MAYKTVSGTFTATGVSASFELPGNRGPATSSIRFNITLSGTFSATVAVERSFDAGDTWHGVSKDADGNPASYTAPIGIMVEECETPALYRLNCTHTSGTVSYRISA